MTLVYGLDLVHAIEDKSRKWHNEWVVMKEGTK